MSAESSSDQGEEPGRIPLAATGFDDLLREVLNRVHSALDERARWQLLLDAVVSMGADLELDNLLARIVEIASELADAKYAALGVLGVGPERRLRTFITHGVTPEQKAKIGNPPTGHGILGLIIDRPEPLRLHDLAEHPVSYGFPKDHPPMKGFLGVPIRIRDKIFGNLYLTEKLDGGDFTEQDEEIVVALAAAAGVAIENARLYEEAARREQWLEATAEITALVSGSGDGAAALQAIADRASEVAGADIAWVATGGDEALTVRVVSGPHDHELSTAESLQLNRSVTASVARTGSPVSVEDLDSDPDEVDISRLLGGPKLGPAIVVPLGTKPDVGGALGLAWTPANAARFHEIDTALPASFAEQAALALQVNQAREDQQRLALFEDRDRIGRDLHDLVIQRLFAIGLGLQSLRRLSDRPEVTSRLTTAVDDLDATINDIRHTIFALGSMDDAADIQAEVTRIVDRAASPLNFRPSVRFEGPVRTRISTNVAPDVLAVLGEALSNAVRHADATAVDVLLAVGEQIRLVVSDAGRGLPDELVESGLSNMRQRAERLGGHCTITSRPGAGTTVEWSVPAT